MSEIEPQHFVAVHDHNVAVRDASQERAEKYRGENVKAREAQDVLLRRLGMGLRDIGDANRIAKLTETDRVEFKAVREDVSESASRRHTNQDQSDDAEQRRKAVLWDAHEDYRNNQEAYQQSAIEDATAASHDINFGGEHYPAQQPEVPKEP